MHEKHQLVMIICHYRIFNAFDVNQLVSSLFDKIVTAKFTLKECPATIYAFVVVVLYIYIFSCGAGGDFTQSIYLFYNMQQ